MGNSEAIGHLREIIGSGESDMLLVAEEMLDIALNKGILLLAHMYVIAWKCGVYYHETPPN